MHAATRIEATDRRQLERLNLVRYHGVLAPASPDRAQIVPGPSALTQTVGCEHASAGGRRCHRVSWAKLLARVFQYDVTVCPSCAGHMQETSGLHHCCPHCAFCGGGFSQRGRPAIQSPTHRPGSPGSPTRIRRSGLSRRRNGRQLQRMGLCPNPSAWIQPSGPAPSGPPENRRSTSSHRSRHDQIACTGNTRLTIIPPIRSIRIRSIRVYPPGRACLSEGHHPPQGK